MTRLCQGSGSIAQMRDYLAATRERVVVFDGSMGATLEQYDLTPADYGGLQGKCHEALILHRPDVIQALHESMIEAGAEVVQTDSFQASRLKLEEWGLGEHTLEINQRSAEIARKAVGEDKLRRRVDRPDRPPARLRRPDAGQDHLPRARRRLRGAGARARPGRRRPHHHRDGPGHPRGQGRRLRRPRGVQGARALGPDPDQRLAAAQRRQDAAGHRHQRRADHARGAEGRRARPQLLHRPRGHARRDPLPRRVQPGAGALHPQRRAAAAGPQRRDDLPRGARAAGRGARRVRRALRRDHRRRLLRHDDRAHRRHRRALRRATRSGRARRRARRTSAR